MTTSVGIARETAHASVRRSCGSSRPLEAAIRTTPELPGREPKPETGATMTSASAVTLWTTPICPDCRALKAWLGREGIAFAELDLTDPATADEVKTRFGVRVAPITEIGDWFAYGTLASQKPMIETRLREVRA